MSYAEAIDRAATDAAELESLYQHARKLHEDSEFGVAIQSRYAEEPENLLFAAWHYRLTYVAETVRHGNTRIRRSGAQ